MNIADLVRENIRNLTPYSSARDEYTGSKALFLDANENPFGDYNRYPDPHQVALKKKISEIKNLPAENIFIGNGSDEVIDLSLRIFCKPGEAKIMLCPPTYGMYAVSAETNDIGIIEVPLKKNFQLDIEAILMKAEEAKMIFLCSPNNPTGNRLADVERILQDFQGIVFLDEAYSDFSISGISWLKKYPNLIISQTLSKAWGMAALRLGLAFSSPEIISYFNRIKPPYNVSSLNQQKALEILQIQDKFEYNKALILSEREKLKQELGGLTIVEKIYPSDANFILIKCKNAGEVYQKLIENGIVIRNRSSQIENGLRITVGTPTENQRLIQVLQTL